MPPPTVWVGDGGVFTNSRVLLAQAADAVERVLAALGSADTGLGGAHKVANTLGVKTLARDLALLTLLAARQRDQRREDNSNTRRPHRSSSLRNNPEKKTRKKKGITHSATKTHSQIQFQDGRNCYLKE